MTDFTKQGCLTLRLIGGRENKLSKIREEVETFNCTIEKKP